MKGIIVRVHLRQFMVFTDIELRPGRNVNIIIAPNGCGKSSLIAGIMLGLCGKPHDIGRGSNVGTFVKTGFSEATIEIELLNSEENYVITRHIYRDTNKSSWLLNGAKVPQKQVEELMTKLHIQVDNLCQVLPQDRVYEFSRMNPQTLLQNTEKSVGPEILLNYHNALKDMSRNRADINTKLNDITARMEKAISQNRGLESAIDLMHKKQVFINEIKVLKQQRAWVMYREQYTLVQEMKEALSKEKDNLALRKKREAQITAGMDKLRSTVREMSNAQRKKTDEKQRLESLLQTALGEVDKQQEALEKVEELFEERKQMEEAGLKELEQLRQHLSKLENDLATYNTVSEDQIRERINKITANMSEVNIRLTETRHEEETIQGRIENITHHIRAEEEKKRRLEDKSNQRLRNLEKMLPDVYSAIMWLRKNAGEFTAKIYEPIMLEIDVKDDAYIQYLEEAIPKRDLQAFTCEDREDMNKFISIVREKLNLSVNVLYSGPEHPPSASYKPKVPIEQLRRYGFNMYVKDMFTAPETIMKYLCRSAGVYRIPVGSAHVDSVFENIPPVVNFFFSASSKYIIRVSKYSEEKCVSINNIASTRFLLRGVDTAEISRIIANINNLGNEKEKYDAQLSALKEKHSKIEGQLGEMRDDRRKLQASIGGREVTERRIVAKKQQIASVEGERINLVEERKKADLKKEKIMTTLCEIDGKIKVLIQKMNQGVLDYEETKWKLNDVKEHLLQREADARSIVQSCAEQTDIVKKLEEQYMKARNEAKEIHNEALKYSGGKKPPDNYYQGITQNREQLSRQIQELQAKADFMSDTNKDVIQEYEERKRSISQMSDEINKMNKRINTINQSVVETREKWLPQLKEFIEKINNNFGRYFAKLDCAGEVLLSSEDPDNYEQYGIHIKVKFRDGDKLQDLNQYTQSGGERSVSTALYMIAIQELTHVPFRCVDEINQGMDPVNERRVFELLVNATEEDDTPQYFLLTPKLLPGLTYNQKMTVSCIMNGSVQKMAYFDADNHVSYKRKSSAKRRKTE